MRRTFRLAMVGTLIVAAVAFTARKSKAEGACCMYDVCSIIWGDGCYGDLCTCTSIPISCCAAGRPCAGS